MRLSELLTVLHELAREDELRAGVECPVWSPYETGEAAQGLEDFLTEHRKHEGK